MNKTLLQGALAALTLTLASHAAAGNLDNLASLSDSEFRTVTEDLGAALSYKPLLSITAQGVTGFDIGVAVSGSDVSRSAAALTRAGASLGTGDTLLTTRLHVHKGLPLGFDIGGFVAHVPALGTNLGGAELRYALIGGNAVLPAVGVRAAYTRMSGSDQLALSTRSLDLGISKGFVLLTPYAGVGRVWVDGTPQVGTLAPQSLSLGKVYAGARLGLGLLDLAFEVDKTGDISSWGLKLALNW